MASEASKLFTQCAILYEHFLNESTEQDGLDVWSGRIIDTVKAVGVPLGGYKRVIDRLIEMECMEQLSRGARGDNLTSFVLKYPPTDEVWDRFVKSSREGLTDRPTLDMLWARLREIQQNIGGMNIVEAFRNHENRMKELESRLEDLAAQQEQVQNKPKERT